MKIIVFLLCFLFLFFLTFKGYTFSSSCEIDKSIIYITGDVISIKIICNLQKDEYINWSNSDIRAGKVLLTKNVNVSKAPLEFIVTKQITSNYVQDNVRTETIETAIQIFEIDSFFISSIKIEYFDSKEQKSYWLKEIPIKVLNPQEILLNTNPSIQDVIGPFTYTKKSTGYFYLILSLAISIIVLLSIGILFRQYSKRKTISSKTSQQLKRIANEIDNLSEIITDNDLEKTYFFKLSNLLKSYISIYAGIEDNLQTKDLLSYLKESSFNEEVYQQIINFFTITEEFKFNDATYTKEQKLNSLNDVRSIIKVISITGGSQKSLITEILKNNT